MHKQAQAQAQAQYIFFWVIKWANLYSKARFYKKIAC